MDTINEGISICTCTRCVRLGIKLHFRCSALAEINCELMSLLVDYLRA